MLIVSSRHRTRLTSPGIIQRLLKIHVFGFIAGRICISDIFGQHLSTLAFSEAGSRSHFWAPTSTARAEGMRRST